MKEEIKFTEAEFYWIGLMQFYQNPDNIEQVFSNKDLIKFYRKSQTAEVNWNFFLQMIGLGREIIQKKLEAKKCKSKLEVVAD